MLKRLFVRLHTLVYRLTGGRIASRWGRAPVLLLTTVGRRTGAPRTAPLLYLEDGAAFVVVATNDGAPRRPQWYLNLQSEPRAEVRTRAGAVPVRAEDAPPAERERLWPRLVAIYPNYQRDQERAGRDLPVVVLAPRSEESTE